MSLDVMLTVKKYPACSHCGRAEETEEVFTSNITHNLNKMADAAGIYEHLWRPEEIEITKASQLIEPLETGLDLMRKDPVKFQKLNPPNGWGSYNTFIPWIADYLEACINNPDADVSVSR